MAFSFQAAALLLLPASDGAALMGKLQPAATGASTTGGGAATRGGRRCWSQMVASLNGRPVLLQPDILELEPLPSAASTGESLHVVETDGWAVRFLLEPLLRFAGTAKSFCFNQVLEVFVVAVMASGGSRGERGGMCGRR
ncbi:uncharacterized protein LOC119297309 [Triticum dicoccoides]|uniref:uncharacterized protein LOC119297309 n=1 Tax=Triticum dicoccoides TaxID=85692 RepID=UPI00188E5595|nr:uncharacterized protein LOC119297309 [Triticum dicoccoides]